MAATEVKLDKLYLAKLSYGSWSLVKVLGAKTQGWLRGDVNVRGFYTDGCGRFRAYVTVEVLKTGKHVDMLVTRKRFDEPWSFSDGDVGLLMEPPHNYIDSLVQEMALENIKLFEQARQNLAGITAVLNLPLEL